MISAYGGWPRDDHVVMDPYGRPSARVSGNEGIVNPPQMERINQWGSIVKGLGLDSYGSLNELWGMRGGGRIGGHSSRLRRFQGGGIPAAAGQLLPDSRYGRLAWLPGHRRLRFAGDTGRISDRRQGRQALRPGRRTWRWRSLRVQHLRQRRRAHVLPDPLRIARGDARPEGRTRSDHRHHRRLPRPSRPHPRGPARRRHERAGVGDLGWSGRSRYGSFRGRASQAAAP
jgi:hypothetical protein